MRDTLSIVYHFEAHFATQMEQVLELQVLDCQFGGGFGVLKSMHFEVSRGQMGLRGFFRNFSSRRRLFVARPHRVYTLFYQYKVAFVNIND